MSDNPIIRFFRGIFQFVRGLIFTIGFLVLLALVILIVKSSTPHFESPEYAATDKIILKLNLEGALVDKNPETDSFRQYLMNLFSEEATEFYVFHLRSKILEAKKDPQVTGLYLNIGNLQGSLADFTELRKVLLDFKSEGKTVNVWSPNYENKTFYLASLASLIHLAPEGQIFLPGPLFQMIYGGEAFRKLGIAFDVIRAGQYKSAFEPFVSNEPSPETLKAYAGIEESLRKHLTHQIAVGRKTQENTASNWMRRSLFMAREAFIEKMVDGLSYREEFEDLISKEAKLVDFAKYKRGGESQKPGKLIQKSGIALIEAIGEMYVEHTALHESTELDIDRLHDELKWAREEQDIKAVVIRVNSPGGSSLAADLLWEDVRRLAEIKPVVVSMGAYAASGGYYMIAAANKIIANPSTITGSIGVISLIPNLEAFREKYGVSFHVITNSDRRNLFNPGSHMTNDDREILTRQVRSTYETFVNRVASGRKKTFQEIDAIGQGRVWTGEQALQYGLVDELGGLAEAFRSAKELAKLNVDEQYPILHYEAPGRSLRECLKQGRLFSCFSMESLSPGVLGKFPLVHSIARWVEEVPKEKILMLLPLQLDVR